MATFYIGNKQIMGGGVGEVNTAKTASNSNALGGTALSQILSNKTYATSRWKVAGNSGVWLRLAETNSTKEFHGGTGLIILEKDHNYSRKESFMWAVSLGMDNTYSITQLTGVVSPTGPHFTKLRVVRDTKSSNDGGKYYVDVFYTLTAENDLFLTVIGCLKTGTLATVSLESDQEAKEYAIGTGFKAY